MWFHVFSCDFFFFPIICKRQTPCHSGFCYESEVPHRSTQLISAFKAPTSRQGPLCYRMQPPCRQGWGLPFLLPGRQSGRCDVSTGAVSVGHETGQAPCLDEKCMNAIDCNAPGVRGRGVMLGASRQGQQGQLGRVQKEEEHLEKESEWRRRGGTVT